MITEYGVIDGRQLSVNDNFMEEAFAKSDNMTKPVPTENAKIPVLSGTISAVSIQLCSDNYSLLGYKGKSCGDSKIIHVSWIPVMISDEEAERRRLEKYANKTFAKVKLSNSNSHYRGKMCEILETKEVNGHKQYLLNIEVGNTCTKSGCMTLVAYMKINDSPYWKKIWFDEDELEFIHYDDGKMMKL